MTDFELYATGDVATVRQEVSTEEELAALRELRDRVILAAAAPTDERTCDMIDDAITELWHTHEPSSVKAVRVEASEAVGGVASLEELRDEMAADGIELPQHPTTINVAAALADYMDERPYPPVVTLVH